MKRLALAAAAAVFASCAAVRPPEPSSLEEGLLIGRVRTHGAYFLKKTKSADSAVLAGLDEKGVYRPGQLASSGFAANGYVVFLGLPAGRYALRSASFPARGARYQVMMAADGEAKRAVDLPPGGAAYLGSFELDSRFPGFLTALGRAARIVGHWAVPFLKRPLLPRDTGAPAFTTGPAEETKALLAVRPALARTQWSRVIAARLRALGAAEPAKTEGSLRTREVALHEEPFLSWRDTLKWGEARRAPDAIAWRRPGGEAQAAVFFTTASAPGFAGWDAAVAELRRSAHASVEDRGEFYEVRVATRVGLAARTTKYRYPDGVLVGSETAVIITETILVPDGWGLYTARLRAPRGEFEAALPAFREFLIQLVLGSPKPKQAPRQEIVMPFGGP